MIIAPRAGTLPLLLAALVLPGGCGGGRGGDSDAGDAAPRADTGTDAARDAGVEAGSDAAPPADASTADAGPDPDAGLDPDAGARDGDVATDAGVEVDASTPVDGGVDAGDVDAGFTLPETCTDSAECGAGATCAVDRCVCSSGYLPCGGGCCPFTYERDVTLADGGHSPELGAAADGTIYVLYKVGSSSVRLATLPAGATSATTETVATSSGLQDDADLAVAPDGTVMILVHQPGSGRSGVPTLYSRAPGATSFAALPLVPPAADVFAFDAAISIARATGGDVYAAASARSGDGTMGLAMARYVATGGVWVGIPTVLGASAYSRSELFARDDGYFLGVFDFPNTRTYYEDFDTAGTVASFVASAGGSGWGEAAAAMSADGVLFTFTAIGSGGSVERSDGALDESVAFTGPATGSRSDIDMALDEDDNPVLFLHSVTHHALSVMVRMPGGGWTLLTWYEASFLPPATTSSWMTLDAERLPNGNLAFVMGDSTDRGPLQLRELSR